MQANQTPIKPNKTQLLAQFKEFVHQLMPRDNLALLFHRDADGLCSGLIATRALEKLGKPKPDHSLSQEYHELMDTVNYLKRKKVNKVIIVDMGVDGKAELVYKLEEFVDGLLILDHHKVYLNLNSLKTVFLKTQFFSDLDGSKYPATKFTYDMFSQLTDLKEMRPIACIGILGDMGHETWKDFFIQTEKDTGLLLADFKHGLEIVTAVETIAPKKFNDFQRFAYGTRDIRELFTAPYADYLTVLHSELENAQADFDKNAEWHRELDLVFYTLDTDHNIKSAICNRLTLQYPATALFVIELAGDRARFSGRRQDFKVKINECIEFAIKDIPEGAGGGHIPAAAGGIPAKYLSKFKENVKKYLLENYKK